MLSYQHIYHAGCLSDVHKHVIMALLLKQLTAQAAPITYIETHAGRGIYDLNSNEAKKTGEAKVGIIKLLAAKQIAPTSAYGLVIKALQQQFGPSFYPGSPAIAAHLLRATDSIHLMELHPQEFKHLEHNFGEIAKLYKQNGYEGTLTITAPKTNQKLIFIDPSYEIKSEYTELPQFIAKLQQKWPNAIIVIWYPLLKAALHQQMLTQLNQLNLPNPLISENTFADPQSVRGMYGNGMYIINTPNGVNEASIAAAMPKLSF